MSKPLFTCDTCGATFDDGIDAGHHEIDHADAQRRADKLAIALRTIDRLYDEGASLDAILTAVGTDLDTLRLVSFHLGVAMSTLRRMAAERGVA